jgi:hypothetical protein
MVALDAIDAFDALWASAGGTATGGTEHTGAGYAGSAHPLGESSLGGLDAVSTWSEDIVGAVAPTPSATEEPSASDQLAMPPWLADDPTPVDPIVEPHASAPSESNADMPGVEANVAADSAIDLRDIADAPMAAPTEVAADSGRGHEPADLGARSPEQAGASTVDETQASPQGPTAALDGASLGGARPRFELIEETAPAVEPAEAALPEPRALQVSATLTRLAERVRAGEIDVTSIAPDATDVAVLASVLAALLGGSRSR